MPDVHCIVSGHNKTILNKQSQTETTKNQTLKRVVSAIIAVRADALKVMKKEKTFHVATIKWLIVLLLCLFQTACQIFTC